MNKKTPEERWSLKMLADFCRFALRRHAVDAWFIGKALALARAKQKEERQWLKWLAEEVGGVSKSSAYRFLKIHELLTLEDVKGKTLGEVYELLRNIAHPDAAPEEAGSQGAVVATAPPPPQGCTSAGHAAVMPVEPERPHATASGLPSWAIEDPDSTDSFEVVYKCDELAEQLSVAVDDFGAWDDDQRAAMRQRARKLKAVLVEVERALGEMALVSA